ncbi:hypothetical protein HGB13_04625 [bacterium]|nr:hypothetical protein [bacterium]
MKKNVIIKLFLTLILSGFIFSPLYFYAQESGRPEGLTVSPPLTELEVKPGERITKKIKVTNPVNEQVKVYPTALDFFAKGETGEPGFSKPSEDNKSYSLASWITFSKSFLVLESQEVEEFEYTITVPPEGEPGGHYGVVFFASEAPKAEEDVSQVNISTMVGSLVLAKVPGYTVDNAKIETFSAPWFSFNAPINFNTRLSNLGNVHFKPKGDITIKNIFGKEKEAIKFNDQNGNVLPESIRRFENSWQPKTSLFSPLGKYTAELKLTYGDSKKEITAVLDFWIIPLWFIIACVVVLLVILFFLIRKAFGKGNNKRKKTKHHPNVVDLRK